MKLRVFLIGGLAAVFSTHAYAQPASEQIVVIGTMANSSIGLAADKMAGTLQSLSADSLSAGYGATVLTGLSSQAAGVSLSDLQGNSMFQDLRFHGIEASPLQGVAQGLVLGADLVFTGSQYFDGDHANQNVKLPPFTTVSLHDAYELGGGWQAFGVVDNLFDSHAASYGTYFDPGDTTGLYTPALTDARMITRLQPVSFQLGVKVKL